MSSNNDRKLLSIVAHGSSLFTSLLISLAVPIALLAASEDEIVKANAREAINFQVNIILWALISALLCLIVIGIPMLIAVGIWSVVAPIVAMLRVADKPAQPHRYSMMLVRLV